MKKYVKPMILSNEDMAEGVFAGSGNCYTFTAKIVQWPQQGHEVYVIQIDGTHNATDGHHSTVRTIVISFNQPITYVRSDASGYEGDGTSALSLTYSNGNGSYHKNAVDYIGLGNLEVQSNDGLAITGIKCVYCDETCTDGHTW